MSTRQLNRACHSAAADAGITKRVSLHTFGDLYGQCPLTASHQGLDGRTTRGSMDDYWVAYDNGADDPYITNRWTQHTWGDAIGDYMKASQSAYLNTDGSTTFYNWTSLATPLTCADMVARYFSTRPANRAAEPWGINPRR